MQIKTPQRLQRKLLELTHLASVAKGALLLVMRLTLLVNPKSHPRPR
jgi:hypothetical protein